MFSQFQVKIYLAASALFFTCATQASTSSLPTNSLDLAQWAQQTNTANQMRSLSNAQRQYAAQQVRVSQVINNPYSTMIGQAALPQYNNAYSTGRVSLSNAPR
ncbi:MAG: hypothetical protein J6N72_03770, partial [Psychrobacter sp.]|nr:hypothetical protein [Psychrobacter sp.]